MVLHYSDELLIINKIAKSQPQWNVWLFADNDVTMQWQPLSGKFEHKANIHGVSLDTVKPPPVRPSSPPFPILLMPIWHSWKAVFIHFLHMPFPLHPTLHQSSRKLCTKVSIIFTWFICVCVCVSVCPLTCHHIARHMMNG